jgi:hypothetical protein
MLWGGGLMSNLTSDKLIRVIYKLVGSINPIGKSQNDISELDGVEVS